MHPKREWVASNCCCADAKAQGISEISCNKQTNALFQKAPGTLCRKRIGRLEGGRSVQQRAHTAARLTVANNPAAATNNAAKLRFITRCWRGVRSTRSTREANPV